MALTNSTRNNIIVALLMLVFASVFRVANFIPNVAPLTAMALFAGAYYGRTTWAFILPLVARLVSDVLVNTLVYNMAFDGASFFSPDMLLIYACYPLFTLVGNWVGLNRNVGKTIAGSTLATVLFFVISNYAVWQFGTMYPATAAGLTTCYTLALPFYQYTFLGDLAFTALFFGSYYAVVAFKTQKATL